MTIDDALANVLKNEGGYSNNSQDAGGETNFGITIAVARRNGFVGQMRDMPRSFALDVYRRQYVIAPGFDKVAVMSGAIAAELVDTGVNMGPNAAGRFLQRALNALVDMAAPLLLDGNVGPTTCSALKAYLDKRGVEGERRLVAVLNAQQGVRYLELTEGRSANRTFLYGWLGRIL